MSEAGEGRVRCGQCGANNFPTQSECWKCAAILAPRGGARAGATLGDTGSLAAAACLGLVLPIVGFAAGLVFLMLGGADRSRVGKAALAWAAVGAATHVLGSLFLAGVLGRLLIAPLASMMQRAASPGGSALAPDKLPSEFE